MEMKAWVVKDHRGHDTCKDGLFSLRESCGVSHREGWPGQQLGTAGQGHPLPEEESFRTEGAPGSQDCLWVQFTPVADKERD